MTKWYYQVYMTPVNKVLITNTLVILLILQTYTSVRKMMHY